MHTFYIHALEVHFKRCNNYHCTNFLSRSPSRSRSPMEKDFTLCKPRCFLQMPATGQVVHQFQHSIVLVLLMPVRVFPLLPFFCWNGHGHYYAANIVHRTSATAVAANAFHFRFNSIHFVFMYIFTHTFFFWKYNSFLVVPSIFWRSTMPPFRLFTVYFSILHRRSSVCFSCLFVCFL